MGFYIQIKIVWFLNELLKKKQMELKWIINSVHRMERKIGVYPFSKRANFDWIWLMVGKTKENQTNRFNRMKSFVTWMKKEKKIADYFSFEKWNAKVKEALLWTKGENIIVFFSFYVNVSSNLLKPILLRPMNSHKNWSMANGHGHLILFFHLFDDDLSLLFILLFFSLRLVCLSFLLLKGFIIA